MSAGKAEKPPVSVCLITLNEESNIRDCLESVKWAGEIVLVDSFSEDRTLDIAREYTDRVVQREWRGINDQRQHCLELASNAWVLCVDADERVTPELAEEIKGLFRSGKPACDAFSMPRRTWYLGRWIRGSGWYPARKVRLFKKSAGRFGDNDPHDKVLVDGPIRKLKHDLLHYSYRDIAHHAATANSFSTTAARVRFRKGKRGSLATMLFKPPWRFFWQYVLRGGFRDGVPGLVIGVLSAYTVFLRCAKLWEMTLAERKGQTPEAS